jgi:hypothetical protein
LVIVTAQRSLLASAGVAGIDRARVVILALRIRAAFAAAKFWAAQRALGTTVVCAQACSARVGGAVVRIIAFCSGVARARLTGTAIAHQRAIHLHRRIGAGPVVGHGHTGPEEAAIDRATNAVVTVDIVTAFAATTLAAAFARTAGGTELAQARGLAHFERARIVVVAVLRPQTAGRPRSGATRVQIWIGATRIAVGIASLLARIATELGGAAGVQHAGEQDGGHRQTPPGRFSH